MSNIKKYNEFNNINEAGGYDSTELYNSHSWNVVNKLGNNLHMMKDTYSNMKLIEEEIMVDIDLKEKVQNFLKQIEPLVPAMHELDMFLHDTDQKNVKRFNK